MGLVVAGCGSSCKAGAAGAAGTDGRAAQAFPASTAAFFDANIDETSPAWKQLLALGARFPSWPKLVAEFDKAANDATDNGRRRSRSCALARHGARVRRARRSHQWLGSHGAGVCGGAKQGAARGRDHEGQGHPRYGQARRLDLFGTDDVVVAISADTALIANDKAVTAAAINRLGGTGDASPTEHLQGHAGVLPSDNIVVGYAPDSVLQKLVTLGRQNDPTGKIDNVT